MFRAYFSFGLQSRNTTTGKGKSQEIFSQDRLRLEESLGLRLYTACQANSWAKQTNLTLDTLILEAQVHS